MSQQTLTELCKQGIRNYAPNQTGHKIARLCLALMEKVKAERVAITIDCHWADNSDAFARCTRAAEALNRLSDELGVSIQ